MAQQQTLFAVLLIMVASVLSVTIRETDGGLVNINIRADPAILNSFLPKPLVADVYGGNGYVTFMSFTITRLETNIAGIWIPTGMPDTQVMKAFIPVRRSDASNSSGYYLMSMDFEHSFTGWVQAEGCSSTQTGVNCQESTSMTNTNASSNIQCSDGAAYTFSGQDVGAANADFVKWMVQRDYKYEPGSGQPTGAQQQGKENPQNLQGARTLRSVQFSSTVLRKRFPALGNLELTSDPCAKGDCFAAPYMQFIDASGTPI
eukprot:PhF_6_TR33540/c0_g1_i1/m.48894